MENKDIPSKENEIMQSEMENKEIPLNKEKTENIQIEIKEEEKNILTKVIYYLKEYIIKEKDGTVKHMKKMENYLVK